MDTGSPDLLLPDTSTTHMLTAQDGTALRVRDWPALPGVTRRGAALLVHGIGEHSGRYEQTARELAAMGLAVRAYDQRGHGGSSGRRGDIPDDRALLDDLRQVFTTFAAERQHVGDQQPPFLLGHSMGGVLSALAVTVGWVQPGGLILSSPAMAANISPGQRQLLRWALRLAPALPSRNGLAVERLSHDPAVVQAYRDDPLVHGRITARLARLIIAAGRWACRDAGRITVPVLLLVAGDDALVDPNGSAQFATAVPPSLLTLHWYDGLWHELFNEPQPERRRVFADIENWLTNAKPHQG